jgi:hypothetical protein
VNLPRTVVAALAALTVATVLPWVQPTAANAAEDDEASPLTVQLTELSPSTIPDKGRVVLTGTVRNDSDELWSDINVHPFVGRQPITDREQLAAAAASDPATDVGDRLTDVGQFAAVGDLVPGQSIPFQISLKARDLLARGVIDGTPGVYWIGVHALGQNSVGREVGGRARTFIPLVPEDVHTAVSLVFPLRAPVRRDRLGRLVDTSDWSATLSDNGRLERIAALLNSAGGQPATMLVDPAVIDAVGAIAADNPSLSLGEQPDVGPSESPRESPSESPSDTSSPSRSEERLGPVDRANAARWLAQV